MPDEPPARPATAGCPLRELAALYLKLGTLAFGGPAAHVAMMEDEVVRRRGWMTRAEFLDLLGASNLIPGPSSTEMAIHVGYRRAGFAGLLVGGFCFILPAALMVAALAWAYVRFGKLPAVTGVLYGVKPVVIAVIVQALWRLGKTALKTPFLVGVALVAAAANALGLHALPVLFGSAAAVAGVRVINALGAAGDRRAASLPLAGAASALAPATGVAAVAGPAAGLAAPAGLWPIFLAFLKIGSVLFGSGYVLLAFLRADLVERLHWMTEAQLLDATAVGQVTPGPVFTTATFVGYLLAGPKGALVATVGIFLPAFVFVALTAPFVRRLRGSKAAGDFLDGLNAASLALMAVVSWQLGRAALVDPLTAALAAASAGLLLRFRVNATWLVLGGALAGAAASLRG